MPNIAACPDRQDLQRFALGQLPLADIERLEQHLNECGSCLAALQQLNSADNLVDAVRAQAATPAPQETHTIRELMARLQGQPPSAAPERTTTHSPTPVQLEDATLAPTSPPAAPSEDATQGPDSLAAAPTHVDGGQYDFLAPPRRSDEIGRLGPFRILAVLGSGGMGVVFRAENLQLKRIVALKVMLPSMARTALARKRFLREAQTAAAIEHENVVTIYRVGQDRGVTFLAMQMLKGESLDDRLQREGKLPIAEVLRIGRETASGLEAAHACGLIHRDIKPANLWLEVEHGRVKILDFGLARAARDGAHLTQSGLIVGTPAYMAPEQARAVSVDQRADLLSLGCMLYRCCTGRLPFHGTDTISILASLALDDPPPPRQLNAEVPPGLSELIMLLLAKDPAARPSSAAAVVKALTSLEAGGSLGSMQAVPKTPSASPPRQAKVTETLEALPAAIARRDRSTAVRRKRALPAGRRRWTWAVAAAVLLAVLAPLGYWGAVSVIRLANGKGQLVIETDDPDVEVRVKRNGEQVTIIDTKTSKKITLQAGAYQLELVGGKEGLTLSTNQFTLNRGGREIVKVRLEDKEARLLKRRANQPATAASKGGRREDKDVRLLEGRHGRVWDVAFSPDGRWVASCGENGTIRLWEVANGREIRCFRGHTAAVRTLSFTSDGRRLLSAAADQTLRLWNVDTGDEIRRFEGHPGVLFGAALSPDGRHVLSGGHEGIRGALWVWDVETAKVLRRFEDVSGQVFHVAWSPDGTTVLSAMHNGLQLWDVASGKVIRTFAGHSNWVLGAAYSSDGHWALSGSKDNTMRLWEVATGRELSRFAAAPPGTPDGKAGIIGVALSRDGHWALSSGADDGILRLWNIASRKEFRRLEAQGAGFTRAAFSPNDSLVAAAATDGFVRLWRLPDLSRNGAFPEKALAPDEVHRFVGHRGPVRGVAISPDGTRALSASGFPYGDRTMRLWDLKTGQQIRAFTDPSMTWVYSVAFLPDGRRALSGSYDHVLRLWNLETGKVIRRFKGGKETIVVTADGRQALADNPDHSFRLLDLESGEELRRFRGHTAEVQRLALSPDGHRILSCSFGEGTMRLWNLETGEELKKFDWQAKTVGSVAFSPDGLRAVSGSDDRTVRLWDLKTGQELRCLRGHTDCIMAVAFLPDGRRVLSCGYDKTLRLWDVETGNELHRFTGHRNHVWDFALSPKGDYVLSGGGATMHDGNWYVGDDFALRLWKIPDSLPKQKGGPDGGSAAGSPNSAQ